jgi:hypothetical protein
MHKLKVVTAGFVVAASFLGSYQATQEIGERAPAVAVGENELGSQGNHVPRTLVVNIGSENHVKAINGLLYAYHSLRNARGDFGGTPYRLNVKVTFGGAGVLHASSKIVHPEVHIATHPQDPVKTADSLIATLVAEGVPMLASGFALKQFDVEPTDLLPGIMPGNAATHPVFIASPESQNTFIMNF